MHRRPFPLLALAIAFVAGLQPPAAHAQMMGGMPHARMFTFGVGGGLALPVNDAKDALKNGFNGLAYARAQLPGMPISFGVNVSFQRFDLKDATVGTTGGTPSATPGNASLLAGMGDVKLDLMHGPVYPYLTVGLGAYDVRADAGGSGTSSTSSTRFGINGGAGLAARFGRVSGYVQGRVDNVYTSGGGAVDVKSIQVIPVTVGVEF